MRDFAYDRADSVAAAVRLAARPGTDYLAGGTDLLNLMKDGVAEPARVVDINALPLNRIRVRPAADAVRIGALARMSDVAVHPLVRRLPVLSEALLAGASPQVRNMASIGGNLLQRTRCWYFRDASMPCNKRQPGSGCPALEGRNRWHAILGGSERCIAVHPSDLAVALTALDATVNTVGPTGERAIPITELYLMPGATPDRETVLRPGELISSVDVPIAERDARSAYLKVRDRATFEFAVVSVAALVRMRGPVVREVRLAFGGIGTRPWRSPEAERALTGRRLDDAAVRAAGEALVAGATPRKDNAFKVPLVQRALADVLNRLGGTR